MTGFRRILVPGVAALIGIAILVSLGVWQLQRREWKEALIARVESRLDALPIPAPSPDEWPGLDLATEEYQQVAVKGRYRNDAEIDVVFALTEPKGSVGGIGYLVMTPFETDDGWTVYINRGFVPKERKDPATRKEGLIEGDTTVTGLLRQPRGLSWFMPGDNVAGNEWLSRDPAAFAAAQGLPPDKVAPYIIDARFDPTLPGGLPQAGETLIDFPNNHLQYALTWFGLAAGLAAVFGVFAWGRLKR